MDAFIGEIRYFAFDYAPEGWALCDGALLRVDQHSALYSVIRNRYGGSEGKTFALPNLMGQALRGIGPDAPASRAGALTIRLTRDHLPNHTHALYATTISAAPVAQNLLRQAPEAGLMVSRLTNKVPSSTITFSFAKASDGKLMNAAAVDSPTSPAEVEIDAMNPYLVLNPCICLDGEYPNKG